MIGKAWVRSMRAFRMVAVVLLLNFHRDSEKTFNEISAYMDEVRKHPTGIQWVNFNKPTLKIHQYLHAEKEGDWLEQLLPHFLQCRSDPLCSVYLLVLARDMQLVRTH